METLFPEPKNKIYIRLCDCLVKGVSVVMKLSIDPLYWVGECPKCHKIWVDKTGGNDDRNLAA